MAIINGTNEPEFINGTSENDQINALGGDDTIFGSLGSDTIAPGEGFDTLDYDTLGNIGQISANASGLSKWDSQNNLIGTDVSFTSTGGPRGTFTTLDAEKVIGPAGRNNSVGGAKAADLRTGDVTSVTSLGIIRVFNAENFLDISGSDGGGDVLIGNDAANRISGNGGGDFIQGLGGDDFLSADSLAIPGRDGGSTLDGGDGNDTLTSNFGRDTLIGGAGDDRLTGSATPTFSFDSDVLTGGAGADRFVLGSGRGSFYLGRGDSDFANITDYGAGDTIELSSLSQYRLQRTETGFKLLAIVNSSTDLVADVTRESSSALRLDGSDDGLFGDLLSNGSDGTFSIASGQTIGSFIGV